MFDKDDEEISKIIETGLEDILSGKTTLEQFMTAHPEQASQIRPELEAAMWLQTRREQVAPRPGFVASSRKRVLARIKQEATNSGAKRAFFGFIWPQKLAYQWVAVVLALIIFFSGTGGLVSAAQGSLPGDGLYTIKRISEKIAYTLAANEMQRVKLSAEYSNRRLDEISSLLDKGNASRAGEFIPVFENQVRETVSLLQNTDNASLLQKRSLAAALQQDFSRQSSELTQLQISTPDHEVSQQLEHARVLVDMSASVAGSVAGGIKAPKATGTFTPTSSGTPTVTASPTPTMTVTVTPTPTGTLFPALNQPNSGENDPSVTGGENDDNGLHLGQTPKPQRTLPSNPDPGGGNKDKTGGKDKSDKTK